MDTFGKRFKAIRRHYDMTLNELAERMKPTSAGFLSTVENDEKKMGEEKLSLLKKAFPEINLNWLLTGYGEMLLTETVIKEPEELYMFNMEIQIKVLSTALNQAQEEVLRLQQENRMLVRRLELGTEENSVRSSAKAVPDSKIINR